MKKQQEDNKKPVNFTAKEKRIAKLGLCSVLVAAFFNGLSNLYPALTPLIAYSFVPFLASAAILVVAMTVRDAIRGVKKVVEVSRRYSGKLTASFTRFKNSKPQIFSGRRYICRARTNARSYRSAVRPAFANASGGGESESDSSGDPPEPLPHVTQSQKLYQKLHSNLFKRRHTHVSGCWRMFCCEATQKVVTI